MLWTRHTGSCRCRHHRRALFVFHRTTTPLTRHRAGQHDDAMPLGNETKNKYSIAENLVSRSGSHTLDTRPDPRVCCFIRVHTKACKTVTNVHPPTCHLPRPTRYGYITVPCQVLPSWKWEFHAHKAILCSSPWWSALLKGGFREGGGDTVDLSGLLLQDGVTLPEALEATVR